MAVRSLSVIDTLASDFASTLAALDNRADRVCGLALLGGRAGTPAGLPSNVIASIASVRRTLVRSLVGTDAATAREVLARFFKRTDALVRRHDGDATEAVTCFRR